MPSGAVATVPTSPTSVPSPPSDSSTTSERVPIRPLASSKFLSQRDLALFNSVCQLEETPKLVGCRCCPDDPAAKWCVEHPGDPFTSIEHVFYGPFSRPGATEAFATGYGFGCGNLSAWGVTWFFRQVGGVWTLVRGEGYAHHVLHATGWDLDDGRRAIVAHDIIGKGAYESIAMITIGDDGTHARTNLLEWTNSSCLMRVPGYFHAVVRYVGANTYDFDKDGRRDLVVTLAVRRRFADDSFGGDCNYSIEHDTAPSPFDQAPETQHVIALLFDGSKLTPEPRAFRRFVDATAVVDRKGKAFEF